MHNFNQVTQKSKIKEASSMTGLLTSSWRMTTNPFRLRFCGVGQPCCLGACTEARDGFDRLNPNSFGMEHRYPFALSLSKGLVYQLKDFDRLSPNG
jgi:hypothetical protein